MRPIRTFVVRASLALTFLLVCQLVFAASPAYVDNRVRDRVAAGETTRVIIQMGDQAHPKAYASSWRDRGPAIRDLTQRVTAAVPGLRVTRRYSAFPFLAGAVDAKTLDAVSKLSEVEAVYPDREMKATLSESGPLVNAPTAYAAGDRGAGTGVAVLDTGIDYTHPALSTTASKFFSDVKPGFWAWRQIEATAEQSVVGGYTDGTYRPSDSVTRAQMAVFIARALAGGDGNVTAPAGATVFTDVPDTYWAYKYIEYCNAAGVVQGYTADTYEPEIAVDRGQMAVFIARALTGGDANVTAPAVGTQSFPDVASSFWAYKYIEYIKTQAVTGGYTDGDYHPEYTCTRDQMAVFIARAFDYTWGGRVVGGVNLLSTATDVNDPMDDFYHGTMVSGIIGSMNTTYRGIAPAVDLVAVKVLDSTGSGYSSDVISGIEWCITNQTTYNLRVINLSLGDGQQWTDPETCDAQPEGAAVTEAAAAGIFVAVAAGNETYTSGLALPACASKAVAAAASKDGGPGTSTNASAALPADGITSYTDRGELASLFAPGSVITAPYPGSQWASGEGTSFASPHVAAAAAILAGTGMTDPAAIKARLQQTGVQIVDSSTGVATPRINLATALTPVTTGPDLITTGVSISSTSVAVGDAVTVSVTVKNQGNQSSGACSALVLLSANAVISPQDGALSAAIAIPALAAGQSYTASAVSGTAPALAGGTYYLGGYVDNGYAVTETNEANNSYLSSTTPTVTVTVPAATVTSSTIPAQMTAGATTSVTVVMQNSGSVTWTPGTFVLAAVSPEGTTRWGTTSVPLTTTVAKDGSATFTFNITAPATAGSYLCHWRMRTGSTYFGEVVTGATKNLAVNDTVNGQDYASASGDRVAYMDSSTLYGNGLALKNVAADVVMQLPDDIPGLINSGTGYPDEPYTYFDLSNHWYPSLDGDWMAWMVDDVPDNPSDPANSDIWYIQVTAYDLGDKTELPRRVTYQNADAWYPDVDGTNQRMVWEDYRNDSDGIPDTTDFTVDNSDIYLADLSTITDATSHSVAVTPICTASGPQFAPRISGNYVVWEDWRTLDHGDIYLYNLSTLTTTRLSDGTTSCGYPDVSGHYVVWCDYSHYSGAGGEVDLVVYDLNTSTATVVAGSSPAAYRQ